MYVPAKFATDVEAAWAIVADAGAGSLVAVTPPAGLASVFVPVIVSADREHLRTHVARANPWWRGLEDGTEVLGLFVAASAYVSPSLYPSRLENPGVVPTWNYVAAEVRGRVHVIDDAEWLLEQVRSQTAHFESARTPPWRVEDAPNDYIAQQLKAIVGIEVEVLSIEGKSKLSQNRPPEDHDAVRAHMRLGGLAERNVAQRMGSDD